jgi:hypothetical protein
MGETILTEAELCIRIGWLKAIKLGLQLILDFGVAVQKDNQTRATGTSFEKSRLKENRNLFQRSQAAPEASS